MPYLRQPDRKEFKQLASKVVERIESEETFDIYDKMVLFYDFIYSCSLTIVGSPRYKTYEKAYGMLNCMHKEFKRRCKHLLSNENVVKLKSLKYDPGTFPTQLLLKTLTDFSKRVFNSESDDWGGNLNFTISYVINDLLHKKTLTAKDIQVTILQVIEDFYEDEIAPYEDIKIVENGEVYYV